MRVIIALVAVLLRMLRLFGRFVGNQEVKTWHGFENRLPECNHSARFSLKQLKVLVQKYRGSAEKFENRLLGPTIFRREDSFAVYQFATAVWGVRAGPLAQH